MARLYLDLIVLHGLVGRFLPFEDFYVLLVLEEVCILLHGKDGLELFLRRRHILILVVWVGKVCALGLSER